MEVRASVEIDLSVRDRSESGLAVHYPGQLMLNWVWATRLQKKHHASEDDFKCKHRQHGYGGAQAAIF